MDKELRKFLSGETNYYKGEISISREPLSGRPVSYYTFESDGYIIKELWGNLGRLSKADKEKKSEQANGPPAETEKKSMGGKKPYVMLMTQQLKYLRENGKVTAEQIGYLILLSPNIEWGSGRLIGKKATSLKAADIQKVLGISHNTFGRLVKELKENKLMTVNKGGYFISTDLFKRGVTKIEDRKQNGQEQEET